MNKRERRLCGSQTISDKLLNRLRRTPRPPKKSHYDEVMMGFFLWPREGEKLRPSSFDRSSKSPKTNVEARMAATDKQLEYQQQAKAKAFAEGQSRRAASIPVTSTMALVAKVFFYVPIK
jgi:hypothetical protein